uniref:Sodium channel protein n=1 Tax=Ciona savignyi TaxID=51511 RepID=H2YKN9_CIOSA
PEKLLEPIEDPDPFYKDKKTFLVLNENRLIFRFSKEKSLFLFGKDSKIRQRYTYFNGLVIVTILLNCLVMMITGNDKPQWSERYVEHIFTAIYTIEATVKIVGRGFALHRFSYLRDPWNWLDFIVILAAYILVIISQTSSSDSSKISSLTFLRAIRVLRVFKTVSVIPGLRMIVSALVASTKALKDAMLLSLLGFSMFSLVGFQFFRGTLHHKCVLRPPAMLPFPPSCYESYNGTFESNISAQFFNSTGYKFDWIQWTKNPQKYLRKGADYRLCGNISGTLQCPAYTICLKVGSNPNFGFTSFDNFPFAFLSVFRLSLQDNWEELYLQVLETSGPVSVLFFLTMIFLGSYYLVNLILAVVASSYEGQRKSVENALEEEKVELLNEKVFCLVQFSCEIITAIISKIYAILTLSGSLTNYDERAVVLSFLETSMGSLSRTLLLQLGGIKLLIRMAFTGPRFDSRTLSLARSFYDSRLGVTLTVWPRINCFLQEILTKRRNAARTFASLKAAENWQPQKKKFYSLGSWYKCGDSSQQGKNIIWNYFLGVIVHVKRAEKTTRVVIPSGLIAYSSVNRLDLRNFRTYIISISNLIARTSQCHLSKSDQVLWSCCEGSSFICRIRSKLHKFFTTSAAEMITVSLVILNTCFMAMEKEPKDQFFKNLLYTSNVVFTVLFAIEMGLKIFALSPYHYFKASWNIFDFVVVTLSVFELVVSDKLPDGLSVLRTFRLIRLVRILKLAKSWPTLSKLMQMIADSLSKVGYLTLVLLIVLVIFALAGMQTIGTQFYMDKTTGLPLRWHMNSFPHAFLVVFRIQCGEWIQSMWSCMNSVRSEGADGLIPVCLFIFLGVVFVGNLVVLNLFLALLLNSFNSDELNAGGKRGSGAKKFLRSLRNAGRKAYLQALPKLPASINRKRKISPGSNTSETSEEKLSTHESTPTAIHIKDAQNENGHSNNISSYSKDVTNGIWINGKPLANGTSDSDSKYTISLEGVHSDTEEWKNEMALPSTNHQKNNSVDCGTTTTDSNGRTCTSSGTKSKSHWSYSISLSCGKSCEQLQERWCRFRATMNMVVQHNIFESFIIFVILLSSVALVFDDVTLPTKPKFKYVLSIFDRFFTAIFVIEMLMKWVGFGFRKYFTNGWCLLDFFIVVSLISLSLEIVALQQQGKSNTDLSSLRVLRSLRAFRPLRAMSRFEGIKVVTDALFRSIPAILNVFVICLIFWLIFAIMGVNLFAGKMASCKWKETGQKVWHKQDYAKDSCNCLANITGGKVHWTNLPINFDNVMIAYISLLQVATFKGWMPIMYAAVDAPMKIGEQPTRDANIVNYFFFVGFIIFGAFFTLNLFISVVIDNFNQQKKKFEFAGTELFLTDTQKKVYSAMKKLKAKLPKTLFPVPKSRWRERLYLFTTGDKFELGVMVITILNLLAMALEFEGMSAEYRRAIRNINYGFVVVFTIEITIRIIAMGKSYFYVPWNVFDFLLIFASVLGKHTLIISYLTYFSVTSTPWLPMFRMVRVARILRVARVASGIRTLLFALMLSAPALFNVGSLLFLFVFIYAIFGMNQFAYVEKKGALNEILNFETFPNTFLLLFQMSTSAGWDGFMEPTLYVDGNSECKLGRDGQKGTCMSTSFVGYFYFVSYLLVTFVIITNMYIAIILENFDLATKDNEEALTADDFEHFFDMWQRYDKNGNGKLGVSELSELLHNIDRPLRIRKPNKHHIANMRIPMDSVGDIEILDVASALTKKIIGKSAEL